MQRADSGAGQRPDHIGTEEHPDYAHYRDSKKRLFAQCRHGIFNADDPEAEYMMAGSPCEKSTYAIHRPADLRAEGVNILKAGDLFGMEFTAAGTTYRMNAALIGDHIRRARYIPWRRDVRYRAAS